MEGVKPVDKAAVGGRRAAWRVADNGVGTPTDLSRRLRADWQGPHPIGQRGRVDGVASQAEGRPQPTPCSLCSWSEAAVDAHVACAEATKRFISFAWASC